ncbi:MAG: response regulator [Nitrospira sp.]|nr:response regulator [Nitrospira sp.]
MDTSANLKSIFPGNSEMAQRMRAFDWLESDLGLPENWPDALKTSVRIILTSRQPMFVWWGNKLLNLYNDGYAGFLLSKHPNALGKPASAVWPEIWHDVIAPRVEYAKLQDSGAYDEAMFFVMHRGGYPEETYATFSYSPIVGDDGRFGGILCPVTEETERIQGQRQLALLRELAAKTLDARNRQEAYALVAEALSTDKNDLPFALIYELRGSAATLEAAIGVAPESPAAPQMLTLDRDSLWPLRDMSTKASSILVSELTAVSEHLPKTRGQYPITRAIVLPLLCSAEDRKGALIIGLSPLRPLDDHYREFLHLISVGVSSAIQNADACETHLKLAQMRKDLEAESRRSRESLATEVRHQTEELRASQAAALNLMDEALEARAQLAAELNDTKLLQNISATFIAEESNALYDKILDAAVAIMRSEYASIQRFHPDRGTGGELQLLGFRGFNAGAAKFWEWVGANSESACGAVLRGGTRVVVSDVERCDFMAGTADQRIYLETGVHAVQTTPLLSRAGILVGMISTHWRQPYQPSERDLRLFDILARQAADLLERSNSEALLRESESRFRELVERSSFGIYIVDSQFHILLMNESSQRGIFRNVRPIIGRDVTEAVRTLWPEPVADEIVRAFRHTLDTGESYHSHDFMSPRADVQDTESYEWELHRMTLSDGRYGVICYSFDSTKLRETEQVLRVSELQLREFNNQLEERVKERTNELLTSQQRLRSLATELNLAEQRERKRLAVELHDHLQQLLVLGKLKLGQGRPLADSVPACAALLKATDEVLSEALQYTRTLVGELSPPVLREHGLAAGLKWLGEYMLRHDLNVTVQISEVDIELPEDQAILMFQSVRELLMNCRKHASTKDAQVMMDMRNGLLHIEVRDQGIGFELAAAAAAADSHTSNVLSSKFGLFSIGERMKALGGLFEIASAPETGTTARLTLPITMPNAPNVTSTLVSSHVETPRHQHGSVPIPVDENRPIRVVLVDDHAMVREGLRTVLETYADVQVIGEACDGAEALFVAEHLLPHVVVMDINMPKMNGIEATGRLKERYPHMIVIGLSVNAGEEDQAAMKRAGATTLITKDAAVEQLHTVIAQLVRQSATLVPPLRRKAPW